MNEVEKTMSDFAKKVIKDARKNLKTKKQSGKLANSLRHELTVFPSGVFTLEFFMNEYGLFQDKGVSGVEKKYATPYSYKRKGGAGSLKGMPPPRVFDKWSKNATRSATGRFTKRKGVNFAAARTVFLRGIRPSLFFTKPFDKYFSDLPDQVVEAYGLELDKTFKAWLTRPNYTGPNPNV